MKYFFEESQNGNERIANRKPRKMVIIYLVHIETNFISMNIDNCKK